MNKEQIPSDKETLQESYDRILAEFPRLKKIDTTAEGEMASIDLEIKDELENLKSMVASIEQLQEAEFSLMDKNGILRQRVRVATARRVPGGDWEVKLMDMDDQSWNEDPWPLSLAINRSLESFEAIPSNDLGNEQAQSSAPDLDLESIAEEGLKEGEVKN